MKLNKKIKNTYKLMTFGTVSLMVAASTVLITSSTNHHLTANTSVQNDATSKLSKIANASANNITSNNLAFTIRTNPTNGFNELVTPDGKYTYVLITKNSATPETGIGGANSGIACIDNTNGNIISTWYLPGTDAFKINYTTNIVFGQTNIGKFDPNTLFVLCGISNLAAAINSVYTGYNKDTHELTTNLSAGPTIKIFKLNATNPNNIINAFGSDKCYNFAYPSDGNNGYAGFNSNGVPFGMQVNEVQQHTRPGQGGMPIGTYKSVGYLSDGISHSINFAKGVNFDSIANKNSPWTNGIPFFDVKDATISAFNSYLTYLTFGQNFAYHRGQSENYSNKDEFLMSTSFVNVDVNIGGLYSASSFNSTDKPLVYPFGYQWLLADIAYNNNNGTGFQYSYVDATGKVHAVNWGSPLALKAPILNFLSDNIFPLEIKDSSNPFWFEKVNGTLQISSLFNALQVRGRLGANWGSTTGYIIFTPTEEVPTVPTRAFTAQDISKYRYYYIAEMAYRSYDDSSSSIERNSFSSSVFTNLLATDQIAPDGTITYLVGVANAKSAAIFNNVSNVIVKPFANLLTNAYVTMFNYGWDYLANDEGQNLLVQPLDSQLSSIKCGYWNDYISDYDEKAIVVLHWNASKDAFKNWNLVFLGGATDSQSAKMMDTSFTYDPAWGDMQNSYVYHVTTTNDGTLYNSAFLQHQLSFAIYAYKGFVYFNAGTSLAFRNGFSIWQAGNVNKLGNMNHAYASRTPDNPNSVVVGTVFLSENIASDSEKGEWAFNNDVLYGVKQIHQPYWYGGITLAFISASGIFTIAGGIAPFGDTYTNSVNSFLTEASTYGKGTKSVFILGSSSSSINLLKAIKFSSYSLSLDATPAATVIASNYLYVKNPSATLYSVQENMDYLISKVVQNPPSILLGMPAAKPLINVNDIAITIDANKVNAWISSITNTDKTAYIKSLKLSELVTKLGIVIPLGYQVANNYDPVQYGEIFQILNNQQAANIEIPIQNMNNNIIYYVPIKDTNSPFGFQTYYTLTNLGETKISATPLVVLKKWDDISQALTANNLSFTDLVQKYGYVKGQSFGVANYVQENVDFLNPIFIDDTLTTNYTNAHPALQNCKYWIIPEEFSSEDIRVIVWYSMDGNIEKFVSGGEICSYEQAAKGNYKGNLSYQLINSLPANQGPVEPTSSLVRIIIITVSVIIAVIIILGLSIGLPVRKQRHINSLNDKITNKRIDKLSGAVNVSFMNVLNATSSISDSVTKLQNDVNTARTNAVNQQRMQNYQQQQRVQQRASTYPVDPTFDANVTPVYDEYSPYAPNSPVVSDRPGYDKSGYRPPVSHASGYRQYEDNYPSRNHDYNQNSDRKY